MKVLRMYIDLDASNCSVHKHAGYDTVLLERLDVRFAGAIGSSTLMDKVEGIFTTAKRKASEWVRISMYCSNNPGVRSAYRSVLCSLL